jgi:hypothetical protein
MGATPFIGRTVLDCSSTNTTKPPANTGHKEKFEINGAAFNEPSGFVVCNNSGFWLWDGAEKVELIANRVDGSKCQMNDSIAGPCRPSWLAPGLQS